jgi:hypothetical protein
MHDQRDGTGFLRAPRGIADAIVKWRARRRLPKPCETNDGRRRFQGQSAHALVSKFESLGENCEFGLVQRRCGAEPLGLFRFALINSELLRRALDADLMEIANPNAIEITRGPIPLSGDKPPEFLAYHAEYGMKYHIGYHEGEMRPERLRPLVLQRLRFLVRKLNEDLAGGEKIIVHRTSAASDEAAIRLGEALQRRGPNLLLWVVSEESPGKAGSIECIARGVLKGQIEGDSCTKTPRLDTWMTLCGSAYALWRASATRPALSPDDG